MASWLVITEKRNIQASALKTGNNPSDYFGFYYSDDNLVEKLSAVGADIKLV